MQTSKVDTLSHMNTHTKLVHVIMKRNLNINKNINQCSFHTQLMCYFTSDPQCIFKHMLARMCCVLGIKYWLLQTSVHAYVCACDHVCLCTPVYLAWRVKHCKPISPKHDIQNAIQTLPGAQPMKWTGSKAASPIRCKAGRAGLSAEIDSWQFYCPEHP